MVKNYLKIALRNILKNKVYSLINIIGLSIGISTCILISLYVINQESYDSFNKNANRIYRATMVYRFGGVTNRTAYTGTKLLPAFERNFSEVESGVRMYSTNTIVKFKDEVFEEPDFTYADSTFFKVFSFKLIQGNPKDALSKPFSVILTSSAARKYFGNKNAVGKVLRITTRSLTKVTWHNFTVTGVMQNSPSNSQIKFDFLASFSSLVVAKPENEEWWDADYYTYLLLKSPESIKTLQAKIPSYMKTQKKELGLSGSDYMTFQLEPLLRVHLYSNVQGGFEPPGDYMYVIIFSLVALLVFIIACVNYINITTTKAVERAKEVGIRKVAGAFRFQLFYQFITESFTIVFIAFLAALMLVEFTFPLFKDLLGINRGFSSLISPLAVTILVITILLVSLIGGGYPAIVLSGFQPIKVLKGNFKTGHSGISLRKGLIIFQFIVSVVLVICTLIIRNQLDFIQNKKLGFDKNNIVVLPVDATMSGKTDALKNEFLSNSNIKGVTFATRTPILINSTNHIIYNNKKIIVNQIGIDSDFLKTLGMRLIAGSNFTPADTVNYMSRNTNINYPILINEAALTQLGFSSGKAIGKIVVYGGRNCIIKGVVKNFYFASMHKRINPLVLFPNWYLSKMMVKVSGSNLNKTIDYMKKKWHALVPDHPFDMTFLSNNFNRLYFSEMKTQKIFYVFGALAVFLAYLGLFGLISFSLQQRTKEIGIRKTLGAGTGNIISLLSKDYLKLVILANVIACPLAWYAAHKWLEGFAYRIDISIWVFLLVLLLTFAFVFIMIGLQSIKAATANPIKSLRYE